MPGRRGSKALNERLQMIGQLAKRNKEADDKLALMQLSLDNKLGNVLLLRNKIDEQGDLIKMLTEEVERNQVKIDNLRVKLIAQRKRTSLLSEKNKSVAGPSGIGQKRKLKGGRIPTGDEKLSKRTKLRRCAETFEACKLIHGGQDDINPTVTGMLDTLSSKCKADFLASKILNMKQSVNTVIKSSIKFQHRKEYYHSADNKLRSLNIYYCSNVMGKSKYIAVRKASKKPDIPNIIPYKDLSKKIRDVDIGKLYNIEENLDTNIGHDEKGSGYFRDIKTFVPFLARFYLEVNKKRVDKLIQFENIVQKDAESMMFLLAVGGDEAPLSGTTFLISFLNVGKRICSSYNNFLIFGGNVKENGVIVNRYVQRLICDIKYLESKVFYVTVGDVIHKVEFKLEALPNDMKMMAFLAGELSNSAFYFSTFGNVHKENVNNKNLLYCGGGKNDWVPFSYSKRLSDAQAVEKKKSELSKKKIASQTLRNHTTTFIRSLKSRQEFIPLIKEYVDLAKTEPLHLKNNVCKEHFMKVLNVVLSVSNVSSSIKSFNDIASNNLLPIFIDYVRKIMKCNKLAKKIKQWFNESKDRQSDFSFRFRGEESNKYLKGFPQMIAMLLLKVTQLQWRFRLIQIFFQSLNLRKVISYSVRVIDISLNDIVEMEHAGRQLYRSSCLFDKSISPSLWTLANVAPYHSKEMFLKFGLGLGANTMEGREQKHQQIYKYMQNTTVNERWQFVFRHEFISCIYLKENGFDSYTYKKHNVSYFPNFQEGCCICSLKLTDGICEICDGPEFQDILLKCST